MQQILTTENASASQIVNRRMLGLELPGWENVMVASLALAAVIAALVGISTYCVVQLQRQEIASSKSEFDRYKISAAKEVAAARSDADTKIAVAREDAKVAIEGANAEIAKANAASAGSMAMAAEAQSRADRARREAAEAVERAAALEKEAQELKAKNLELEAKIRPRRLSGEDLAKLSAELSKLQPIPIGIVSRLFDPEGSDFADDISSAFMNAHWQAVRQRDWTMSSRGVAIATLEGTILPSTLADALVGALGTANIKATATTIKPGEQNTTSAHFQPNGLYLLVGAKP